MRLSFFLLAQDDCGQILVLVGDARTIEREPPQPLMPLCDWASQRTSGVIARTMLGRFEEANGGGQLAPRLAWRLTARPSFTTALS